MFTPLEFSFSLEPGLSESEIQKLWKDTQQAQQAMNNFLRGNLSEMDLTDVLDICGVDSEETALTLDYNLRQLGLI